MTSARSIFRPRGCSQWGRRQTTGKAEPAQRGICISRCGLVHPAGVLPAVREMLVIENGHRAAGFSDDSRDLLKEIAAGQHLLSQPGHRIVPVLADQQDPVHRQLVASQRQRCSNALVDWNVEFMGELASDVSPVNLVDIERGNGGPRRDQAGRRSEIPSGTCPRSLPAWLLGKKVVTMAAIFGRGLERCAGPTAGSREASSAGSFLAGPEQALPPSSTRVAARPSRRQGTRGKTRVERDNRMGRAEMGKEDIVSWETGGQGLDHLQAAEPGHHPPPDGLRCFQSADPIGFGSGSRIRSARG